MFSDILINDVEKRPQKTKEGHTLQSVLDELTRRVRDVREFVNSSTWLNVPSVLRSWKEGDDSALLVQLLGAVNEVLMETCDADIPIVNKHLLHSSLSSLAQNVSLAKNVRMRVEICFTTLTSVRECPVVLMEREQAQAMVREVEELKRRTGEQASTLEELMKQNEDQACTLIKMEQQIEAHKAEEARRKEAQTRQALRVGGQAIEFVSPSIARYGGSFSNSEDEQPGSLVSFEIGPVVARFTFILATNPSEDFSFGIVAHFQTANAINLWFPALKGGAGWLPNYGYKNMLQNDEESHRGTACLAGVVGQKIVLEADGREGKRTLKLSQDGLTQPTFFSHIPVPFRFAVYLDYQSVTIESLEVVDEPQMVGGAIEVPMDE
ncbi:hypothetical protein BLNAU_23902 [Blattamonas nauphoetae]|uniref:Uncharacterized protein n=1 Tax=Blattamonas nauphoetae TaxID=2049346 RepID=A0ABQ9WPC1_9EUKA|nr:hypothetical protein BLNAU_23902 [Blattamonas nauphoetae]